MASVKPVQLSYNTHEPECGADENLSPIIFLHAVTAVKETWRDIPQIIANATNRRTYNLDARNHGESEWTERFDFDVNADDLVHFMDTRRIGKAILVGHSMGGMTAIKTALRWPDRVERIVVEDMFVKKCPPEIINSIIPYVTLIQKGLEEAPADLDEHGTKTFLMQYLFTNVPAEMRAAAFEGKNKIPRDDLYFLNLKQNANGRFCFACNLEIIKKALGNLETIASDPQGKFEGPALFTYGKESPFMVGAEEHRIKQFFPNAVLEGIENAGHDIHSLDPQGFTDAVLKFFS